jgi:hypothetical protein
MLDPKILIMVGDAMLPREFSPSYKFIEQGYNKSLFERLLVGGARYENFKVQLRLCDVVNLFTSKQFYEGTIRITKEPNFR